MNSEVLFDLEADSLTPTKIHMWGQLRDGKYTEQFQDFTYEDGVTYYAHNGIGYDYPVLSRLHGLRTG